MTKEKTLTIGKDSAIVKAIGDCWDFLNQIDPDVLEDQGGEMTFHEVLEAVRLAINELDEMGLIVWQPEQ